MKLLKSAVHPDIASMIEKSDTRQFIRKTARGIILRGEEILLLYTERYHDYTLPGGGIDEGEDIECGLRRELMEETGAQNIEILQPFGQYDEFRPWYKDDFDIVHIESFCYVCSIDETLGQTRLESHEIQNGMRPVWINIHEAITHNEHTMANSEKKGMSIDRETFLLKLIVENLLTADSGMEDISI